MNNKETVMIEQMIEQSKEIKQTKKHKAESVRLSLLLENLDFLLKLSEEEGNTLSYQINTILGKLRVESERRSK